jgi:hypothetical protein
MPIGFNCRHCGHSPKAGKRKKRSRIYKKRTTEQRYEMVKKYVLRLKLEDRFTKEQISVVTQLKEHEVAQALFALNLEGIVSKPLHLPPHDGSLDSLGGQDSSWCGDIYKRIR